MNYITVKSKDLKPIIQATFPGYKKHNVIVNSTTTVTFGGLNWGGGSRSEYRACTVTGEKIENKINMNAPAPWMNPFEGKTISLPVDAVIVEGGYFCGKVSTLFVNVHPDNLPKFLPAPPL